MKAKRFAAAVASLCLVASAGAISLTAGAANYPDEKQAAGGTTTFDKYLVMDKDAEVPNVTSAFSIAAGDALSDPVNGIHCYAGVGEPEFVADDTNSVTVGTDEKAVVTFGPTDTTTAEASVGTKTVAFMTGTDTTDEKFVTKTLTVSFAGIKFPEPGLYRYIITEAEPTDGGVSIPTGHVRMYTLFVAVEDNNGTLEVASTKYVLQEGTDAPTITTETVPGATEGETTTVTVNANKKTGMSTAKVEKMVFSLLLMFTTSRSISLLRKWTEMTTVFSSAMHILHSTSSRIRLSTAMSRTRSQ